jgi:hypothetical protein
MWTKNIGAHMGRCSATEFRLSAVAAVYLLLRALFRLCYVVHSPQALLFAVLRGWLVNIPVLAVGADWECSLCSPRTIW